MNQPVSVDHDLSYAPGYACRHRMTFAEPVTRAEAEAYVESQGYFGYPPAGYGGAMDPPARGWDESRTVWTWTHSHSCD